jgi:replicative DNA helicase
VDDLDLALVAALLRDGKPSLKSARSKGLRPDLLRGRGKDAYQFLVEYHLQFDELPPPEALKKRTGLDLPQLPPNLFAGFLVDEVFNRKTFDFVLETRRKLDDLLTASTPNTKAMVETLEKAVLGLRAENLSQSKVDSLFALGPDVLARYDRIKSGERGILTPWKSINDITLGFWPMDLVLIVARSGVGKSWAAVQLAWHAWQQGKRVLFGTTEMSREAIGTRLYSLIGRFPYYEVFHGKLTIHSEPRFRQQVEDLLGKEGLYIVGGNFDFRVETLSAAIDEIRPDILILDGAYLLKTDGQNRNEMAANAFNELKRVGTRHGIVVAATHQFNREVKTNEAKTVKQESIGLTDVASWNASLILGMVQTDDMKRDKLMRFKPLKAREGVGEEVEVNWNFDTMDFSEIGIVGREFNNFGGDAAEAMGGRRSSDSDSSSFPSSGSNDDIPF